MTAFYAGQRLRASRLNILANIDNFDSVGGCTLSTTSATYVDITNASKSFTKLGGATDSDLIIAVDLALYATVAPTVVKIGVRVNGTDTDAIIYSVNSANVHLATPAGTVHLTGLAAGAYTVQLRALRVSGTGAVTMDSNDTVSMLLSEKAI